MMLPTPDAAFDWSIEPWGHALRCRPLARVAQHWFTGRQPPLRSPAVEPAPAGVVHTGATAEPWWVEAAISLGVTPDRLIRVRQVHGASICVVRRGDAGQVTSDHPLADAIIADVPDRVLAIQIADCVPLLMADQRLGAAAAVHAGWRGTCAGVAAATVQAMVTTFGTRPADLTVAIGPSIGACCYEVGPEVFEAFRVAGHADAQLARWFAPTEMGTRRLDLPVVNREQLRASGVPDERIFVAALCTQTHAGVFDSYRARRGRAGRMAAIIRVPPSLSHPPEIR
jgi:polyphenol oxidase